MVPSSAQMWQGSHAVELMAEKQDKQVHVLPMLVQSVIRRS
jgi:hypothetical protein